MCIRDSVSDDQRRPTGRVGVVEHVALRVKTTAGLGVVGWTIAGFISKDKAILTNFGLQIPLFVIGIYKIIF